MSSSSNAVSNTVLVSCFNSPSGPVNDRPCSLAWRTSSRAAASSADSSAGSFFFATASSVAVITAPFPPTSRRTCQAGHTVRSTVPEWPQEKHTAFVVGLYLGVAAVMAVYVIRQTSDRRVDGAELGEIVVGTLLGGFIPLLALNGLAETWTPPAWSTGAVGVAAGAVGIVAGLITVSLVKRFG